jgi:hypothetical protein
MRVSLTDLMAFLVLAAAAFTLIGVSDGIDAAIISRLR